MYQSNIKVPRKNDFLTWGKGESWHRMWQAGPESSKVVADLNKFPNDGSFMSKITCQLPGAKRKTETEVVSGGVVKPEMSANRIAARVMQLRMKGKHEEADNLLAQISSGQESESTTQEGNTRRNIIIMHGRTARQKKNDEDVDLYFANAIIRNKFSTDGLEDDECDHDDGSRKKSRKGGSNHGSGVKTNFAHRILTQQERCQFCFENPTRPRNLIISISNFVYLMLPPWQPVVPGHCCILPLHHEVSTRNVENNIWDEIRNFKICLIRMFANQEKEIVFIETVMGLAHQQRHCLIECIPLPNAIAKQAPLYFKKAIDDAEDEWSQHDAKKLIDTSVKGLRSSIPKDFPYFHVEFGLSKGFAHVIDDETKFKSNFGLNVIRGMLKLPAEDLHRPKKHEAVNLQKEAVGSFIKEWEPYDWVRQLD